MPGLESSTVLVTGAAGFLAGHIIPQLLENGAKVIGIDIRPPKQTSLGKEAESKIIFRATDITNYLSLEKLSGGIDYVMHLAAMASPDLCERDPTTAFVTNVQGTFNLLKFAARTGARKFVFSSTAHVYGISPKYMPTDENHPLALQDTYTTTKIIGESLCQLYYSNHNLEYLTIRLFNAYGPGQSQDYFIPATIARAMTGRIVLRGRHVTKDFVYAEDVARAYCSALTSGYVGEVNIGSGKQTKLEEVAHDIARSLGADLSFSEENTSGPTHMQCDPSRAERLLRWKAVIPIEQGLSRTIDSIRKPGN